MRHVVVPAAFAAVACGAAPPTCDDAACTEICEAHEAQMRALVPEGGALLSAYEAFALTHHLAAVRAGVRAVAEEPLGICTGRSRCERFLGSRAGTVPHGPHLLRASFHVPPLGQWEARLVGNCMGLERPDHPVEVTYDRVVSLAPDEDGIARFDPLIVFPVVPPGGELVCTGEIRFPGAGPDERSAQWGFQIE